MTPSFHISCMFIFSMSMLWELLFSWHGEMLCYFLNIRTPFLFEKIQASCAKRLTQVTRKFNRHDHDIILPISVNLVTFLQSMHFFARWIWLLSLHRIISSPKRCTTRRFSLPRIYHVSAWQWWSLENREPPFIKPIRLYLLVPFGPTPLFPHLSEYRISQLEFLSSIFSPTSHLKRKCIAVCTFYCTFERHSKVKVTGFP